MDFNFYEWVRDGVLKSRLRETDKEFEARMMAKSGARRNATIHRP